MSGDNRYVYEFFFRENAKDARLGTFALESSNPFDDAEPTAESAAQPESAPDRYTNLRKLMGFLALDQLNYTAAGTRG